MKFLTSIVAFALISFGSHAQIVSNGTGGGAWSLTSTWAGKKVPVGGNNSSIIIKSGDVVYVPSGYAVSIDQMVIQAGATVNVMAGGTMTIANGTGDDLTIVNNGASTGKLNVYGLLNLSQTATTAESGTNPATHLTASTTTIRNGGVYRHNYSFTGGTFIGATWEDGSTAEVRYITTATAVPANLGQSFYNFTWDCAGQRSHLSMSGALKTVRNNLNIGSTGGAQLKIFGTSSGNTLNIGGNATIYSDAILYFSDGGVNNIVNVTGDLIVSSASTNIFFAYAGSCTFNVTGSFQQTNSAGRIFFGNAAGAVITMNLYGDAVLAGQLRTNNGSTGIFNFRGVTNFSGGANNLGGFSFVVHTGATLNLGTSYLKNTSGSFTLMTGAVLGAGSTDAGGAIQANTTGGNIRTPVATRTYASGSTINFNGTSAQTTGTSSPLNATVHATISNPTTLTVSAPLTVNSLTLAQGTLACGANTITLNGNLTRTSGILSAGTGTVAFSGAANQTVSAQGAQFNNITVNKSGGSVTLSSALNLAGRLQMNSPTTLNSNGNLTILSTSSTNDGSIGPMASGAAVSGNVVVQRYMAAKGNTNRYISSPVAAAPVSMLQDDFPVTGPFTGTSYPCTGCSSNGASLKYLDPTRVNMAPALRFVGYPVAANTETLQVGRGYAAYMWQNRVVNLDYTGTINSGTINYPIVYALSSPPNPSIDGYNLIGNPYASSIIWDGGAGWTDNNISPTVYVPVGNVSLFYNYTDGTGGLTNGIIAMGQGFYVVANGAGASLSINENAKTATVGVGYQREREISAKNKSEQFVVSLEGSDFSTSAYLKLNQSATDDFDPRFDAAKLPLEMNHLSFRDQQGRDLVMHTVSGFDKALDIPLDIEVLEGGEFTLVFGDRGNFPAFYLLDNETGIYTEAVKGASYKFGVSQQGIISERFVLTQNPKFEQSTEKYVSVYPNPFDNQLTIETNSDDSFVDIVDVTGRSVITMSFNQKATIEMQGMKAGMYLARVKTVNGMVVKKVMKK